MEAPTDVLEILASVEEALQGVALDSPEALERALQVVADAIPRALPGATARVMGHDSASPRPEDIPDPLADGEGTVVGMLTLNRPPRGPVETRLVQLLAARAGALVRYNERLQATRQELLRKEDEFARLARAARLITSRTNLQTTLDTILQMALEVTGARYGIVRLLDRDGRLVTGAVAGEELDRPLVEALDVTPTTITGWVAVHRQPLCIVDVGREPWSHLYYPLDRAHEMHAELAVPLLGSGGRLEGVLNLESPRVGAFGDADRLLLQALASQAVIALQEVRLVDALQETAKNLLAWPCARVLQRLVELAGELLGASAAAVFTHEGERRICRGATPTVDELQGDPSVEVREVPLRSPGNARPMGVFCIYRSGPVAPPEESEWDSKVSVCLARYAALALENEARQEQLLATRQQRAVAEMFAAVGDVAANLLHQLNNKIGIIPVRVQSVEDKCRAGLEADPYLARQLGEIRRSAQEAMRVVSDNLRLLRPSATSAVELARCVEQALRMMVIPPGVKVTVRGLDRLPLVEAEEHGLALIFLNIIDNACTALAGRGIVNVRGNASDGSVRVTVGDNGPGIDPAMQERIFEFSHSGRSGLGFGLWWVRTLMTRIGGSVTVESDGRHGTLFRLVFPTCPATQKEGKKP